MEKSEYIVVSDQRDVEWLQREINKHAEAGYKVLVTVGNKIIMERSFWVKEK